MARRKKYDDEITKNSGSVGYSQAALDKLNAGTYGRDIGSKRQVQYRTSQEQTQQSRQLPVLEGLTRSNDWESSFGHDKNTLNRAAQYQQNLANDAAKYTYNESLAKANTLDKKDQGYLQRLVDNFGDGDVTRDALKTSTHTKDWEKKYGKTYDEIYRDFLADQGNAKLRQGQAHPILSEISTALGSLNTPLTTIPSLVANAIAPDSKVANALEDTRSRYENQRKLLRAGVKERTGDKGDKVIDTVNAVADRMIPTIAGNAIGGNVLGGVLAGASDANRRMDELNLRPDLDNRSKALTALGQGTVEGIGTAITSGLLDALPSVGGIGGRLLNVGKGAGNAAIENSISEAFEMGLDTAINRENSAKELNKAVYMLNGMSEEDATAQAQKDQFGQVGSAALTGALFGGGMKGLSEIFDSVRRLPTLTDSTEPLTNDAMVDIIARDNRYKAEFTAKTGIQLGDSVEDNKAIITDYLMNQAQPNRIGMNEVEPDNRVAAESAPKINNMQKIEKAIKEKDFKPITFNNPKGESYLITKSTRPGEKWQLSFISDTGNPTGHTAFRSDEELIKELSKLKDENIRNIGTNDNIFSQSSTTVGEMLENPDNYTLEDFQRVVRAYDVNADVDGATKEDIIDFMSNVVAEDPDYATASAIVNRLGDSVESSFPAVEGVIPNRTINESAGQNPRITQEVRGLAGEELKAAQDRVSSNKAQIKALENEIKIIESDPNNKYRGNLKKSAKADIESRKAQIAELKQDNKVTTRQIKGEPTPVIEQLDADSVTRINDFKKEVRKIGNMWGGESGKQLAKDVNDALDRYIESGSQEDFNTFARDLWQLHSSANGEYTSKAGNVSRYSDYYGDIEDGIFGASIKDNGMLPQKAIRDFHNARTMNESVGGNPTLTSEVPPTNPPMPSDGGSELPNGGDRVRSFSRRGSNDETLPDEIRNTLSEDYYNVVRNKDVEAKADSMFIPDNLIQTRSNLDRAIEDHDPTSALLSYKLAKAYVDNGDYDAATDVLQKVSAELTRMGQFTQAAKLAMLQNDPMAAMRSYMRDLEKLNQWGNKKYKNKWNDLELTQEDIDLINSVQKGDSEGLNAVFDSLNERFSKQIPSTWWEKAVSASKTAMLLNLRTQSRNILANMATLPLRSASDRVAALGQNIAHLINDDVDVTQSLTGGTRAQKKIASEVFERFKDEITGDNKMKDSVKSDILSQKQTFNNDFFARWVDNLTNGGVQRLNERLGANGNQSTMETLQNFTYWLMGDFGDTPFVKKNFVNRLASYMKAQGIDNIDDIPDEAISIATQEALKATFKDDNAFTRALQGVKQKSGKFGEIALPFVKTPANLTMRAIDYSPAGIINTIRKARSGAEASAVIDELSKNITGTALIYLGYKLAEKGLLSGSYSQDKDEAAFQKQQGMLENAIHIGDNYYTYDWTQPASTPLILGQTIYEAVKASDKENASIKDIVNATSKGGLKVANTIINSSPLQSLSDLLGESQYGDEGIAENIANEILEFPQRFIPSLVGATARTIDPVMRDTYIKDSTLTGALGNQARSAMAKIPFLSQTLPASYDTWGNERTRSDSKGEAFFAQMINPGQLGNRNETPLDGEIQRLFDMTGNKAVFPISAARSLDLGSDGNITLTNKQHSDYQKAMGQRSYSYAESIMNDADYKSLSDDDKVKILEKAYKLSNDITKEEMFDHVTTNDKTLKEIARTGDSKAVAKALINGVKANELGMSLSEYQKKEDEQPGGAQAYVQKKEEAVNSGFVNKSGNADVKGYEKAISQAGAQSQKFVNDLPMLQQTGLEKSAYYTYANAINVIPSLTPSEFAQTYNEINTNTSNAMTQKELLDYLNKYQFSNDPAEDERIANELWRAYGGWKNKAGVEKKIKLQNGQWKSYY